MDVSEVAIGCINITKQLAVLGSGLPGTIVACGCGRVV